MDYFMQRGGRLPKKSTQKRAQRIVCIGAGPASLACAAELAQQGFSVTVIERRALPGGLNTYGVAEYKLRSPDSLREVEMIAELGVEFRFGLAVENEDDLAMLEKEYDAIFVGIGLGAMNELRIPGADHSDVIDALEFIARYKTAGQLNVGNNVVVVGAGNTAIDAANAARRLGAARVTIVYRRTESDMPAFGFEYEHAKQEGVLFEWLAQPIAIHVDPASGRIVSFECMRNGSNLRLPCDMVIPAIGQSAHSSLLERSRGPKYFSGGDCVNGGREVVDAVADGKRAALAIMKSFQGVHTDA
jgi:glutamate synthase (NADPH/NADH) small chain